jgi:threonine/homoserine/homoserine lactone efflux protein
MAKRQRRDESLHRRAGLDGTSRGRAAAGIDAIGAAMGILGLIAFAILIWRFLPSHSSPAILTIAGLAWLAISVLAWRIRKAMKKLKAARRRKVT